MGLSCYTFNIQKEITLEDFVKQVNCGCTLNPVKEWQDKINTADLANDGKLGDIIYLKGNQWYLKAGARFSAQANPEYIKPDLLSLSASTFAGMLPVTVVASCSPNANFPVIATR
ncbi:hypothetical protein K1X76_10995 [bacterium]|nr:hypothetical protein [bacterium]